MWSQWILRKVINGLSPNNIYLSTLPIVLGTLMEDVEDISAIWGEKNLKWNCPFGKIVDDITVIVLPKLWNM